MKTGRREQCWVKIVVHHFVGKQINLLYFGFLKQLPPILVDPIKRIDRQETKNRTGIKLMAPKVRPIPAVLPTLKADLQVMCRLHGLAETGTIAELTDRLETTRDGTDEEGEEWPEELEKMRMADLRALAKKLGVDPAGTKSELIEKIKEARDGDPTAKAGVKRTDDGWAAAMAIFAPRMKLEEMALDWGVSAVLLTPAIWPILLWREPIGKTEVYGPVAYCDIFASKVVVLVIIDAEKNGKNKLGKKKIDCWKVVQFGCHIGCGVKAAAACEIERKITHLLSISFGSWFLV
jgi:hypothetical protein